MTYTAQYLADCITICQRLDHGMIDHFADLLAIVKARRGRLFWLGVGGSAANCGHAVNDFRKIAHIESYAATDNVAELTARTNDEGWDRTFVNYLEGSRLNERDAVIVLSVGGGSADASYNIVKALQYAQVVNATILGIVGRDGGYTARVADCCIIVPTISFPAITPYVESFQAVLWHLLVNHPDLQV